VRIKGYLTVSELAERWGTNIGTLCYYRHQGKGPRFEKMGYHIVLYPVSSVIAEEKAGRAIKPRLTKNKESL
jgi:hypothetical protein